MHIPASTLAALVHSPAFPVFVQQARGTGITAIVVALVCFALLGGIMRSAAKDGYDAGGGMIVICVFAFLCACFLLVIGLPRLVDPQGFALSAMACDVVRCLYGG